ncbi:MAG TPA: NAD(+)/NADH kinase, partial [Myxococcota bacterium]|nr:NAD(+)/NADH kinase [Myxococcota bacterium]
MSESHAQHADAETVPGDPPRRSYAEAEHVAFVAARTPAAQAARETLESLYPAKSPEDADVIVALGGDGFMLQTIHRFIRHGKPIYGMNRGSVGFMMNPYEAQDLVRKHQDEIGLGREVRGYAVPDPGTARHLGGGDLRRRDRAARGRRGRQPHRCMHRAAPGRCPARHAAPAAWRGRTGFFG